MARTEKDLIQGTVPDTEERAATAFLRQYETGSHCRIADAPELAAANERVERAWRAVGEHAASPELMAFREQALARARKANARRWLGPRDRRPWLAAAAAAGVAVLLGVLWQLSPYGFAPGTYETGIGEQRVVQLKDHSRIALDAQSHVQVRFSDDARVVELFEGQAQFSVAKDARRPFKVIAGGNSIVAIGTTFAVEYLDHQMRVAMVEGKVAVSVGVPAAVAESASDDEGGGIVDVGDGDAGAMVEPVRVEGPGRVTELSTGEGLRVRANGEVAVIEKADIEAATAWRRGKVIFDGEPLGDAIRRLNRYSRLRLDIDDPSLASLNISGVFEAGDNQAFAEAVESYLPVVADYSKRGVIRLTPVR